MTAHSEVWDPILGLWLPVVLLLCGSRKQGPRCQHRHGRWIAPGDGREATRLDGDHFVTDLDQRIRAQMAGETYTPLLKRAKYTANCKCGTPVNLSLEKIAELLTTAISRGESSVFINP
jgi:hypothetical protein